MTDLAAYFRRVGYTGPAAPTLETLQALVTAHNGAIPFENLDPVMGIPVADLGQDALFDKLVHRRRGGYCYEQNGVLGYVLAELGFGVQRLGGRVVWMNTSGELPAQTHEALAVTVPGAPGPWLVDVGFGGQTLSSPIRLEVDTVQTTRHEPYRIRSDGDVYLLEAEVRGEWQTLYMFDHATAAADRPRSRKLVCLNVSEVCLRCRVVGCARNRRCPLESAWPQSGDPQRRQHRADPFRDGRRCAECADRAVRNRPDQPR